MQDVFGDDRLQIFGDIFAASTSRVAGSPELAVAVRTLVEPMLPSPIGFGQRITSSSDVTRLTAAFLLFVAKTARLANRRVPVSGLCR